MARIASTAGPKVTRGLLLGAGLLGVVLALCGYLWRGEIWRTTLDPKQPYPTYRPPPAPNYAQPSAWLLRPADPAHATAADPTADVFFVHPTAYAEAGSGTHRSMTARRRRCCSGWCCPTTPVRSSGWGGCSRRATGPPACSPT